MDDTATCEGDELRGCGVEEGRYKDCVDRGERGNAKVKSKDADNQL